jgi:outer membrane protein assembly factor BamB
VRWTLAIITVAVVALAGAGSAFAEVTGASENLRTGWYPDEPSLTPALLAGGGFQPLFKDSLQHGQIYAQPLTANGTLLIVTEENRAYGLDPLTGAMRWEKQFGTAVKAGQPGDPVECTDLEPRVGITGTPVIDTEHNVAYFVSNSYVSGSSGPISWYMHAIDLSSGNEIAGFPVEISGQAQNLPGVTFEAPQELQRPALLMMNGVVYAAFGSHCDNPPYEGWIVGVSTSGLVTTKWATSAQGGSIWQAGGGLVSDGPGQILFSTGNDSGVPGESDPEKGPGDQPPEGKFGESVVRVAVQSQGTLQPTDFFSPFNNAQLDEGDIDLGSSAPVALPSQYFGTPSVPNLIVQDGKQGNVYLLNRDDLGGMGQGPGGTDQVVQTLGPFGGVWDGSAVWPGDGGYVYIPTVAPAGHDSGSEGSLLFLKYGVASGAPTLSLAAESPENEKFGFGSGSPIVTSNGTSSGSGVMWITRCPKFCANAKLVAYNPVPTGKKSLQVLWSAPIGTANKFSRPDASNGHLYVGNREGAVFGYSGPALTPSTASLGLGPAPVGGQATGTVTFTNTGTTLKVGAVRAPSGPFEATGLPPIGTEIKPGQVISVGVAFRPASLGSFSGSLGLTTEAGETNIALSGSTPTVVSGGVNAALTTPSAQPASRSLVASRSGVVAVKVRCPAGERRCSGTVTLRTLLTVRVGSGRFKRFKHVLLTLAVGRFQAVGGKVTTVRLHLRAAARRLLARSGVLHARATIVTHGANGATHTSQVTVTIRAVKATRARRG